MNPFFGWRLIDEWDDICVRMQFNFQEGDATCTLI